MGVFRLAKFVLLCSELSFIAYNLVPLKEQILIQDGTGTQSSHPSVSMFEWKESSTFSITAYLVDTAAFSGDILEAFG